MDCRLSIRQPPVVFSLVKNRKLSSLRNSSLAGNAHTLPFYDSQKLRGSAPDIAQISRLPCTGGDLTVAEARSSLGSLHNHRKSIVGLARVRSRARTGDVLETRYSLDLDRSLIPVIWEADADSGRENRQKLASPAQATQPRSQRTPGNASDHDCEALLGIGRRFNENKETSGSLPEAGSAQLSTRCGGFARKVGNQQEVTFGLRRLNSGWTRLKLWRKGPRGHFGQAPCSTDSAIVASTNGWPRTNRRCLRQTRR